MLSESISVVILTYNRKRLLKDCLDSLLAQTCAEGGVEILVADDGSTDGTRELIEAYCRSHSNVRWLHHKHSGISATRNMGITAARGDFIAIVADDYIFAPDYLRVILDFFRNYPEACIVRFKIVASRDDLGSRISHLYYDSSMRGRLNKQSAEQLTSWHETARALFSRPPQRNEEITTEHELEASGAAAFRREVFEKVGLFDETLRRAEDSDFTTRLRARGLKVYYNPHFLVQHQYEPSMLDTLRKSFESGWSRYFYFRKHSIAPSFSRSGLRSSITLKLSSLLYALQDITSVRQFILYTPFLIAFESANKLGYLAAWMLSPIRSETRITAYSSKTPPE